MKFVAFHFVASIPSILFAAGAVWHSIEGNVGWFILLCIAAALSVPTSVKFSDGPKL